MIVDLNSEIKERIVFIKNESEIKDHTNRILFILSDQGINYEKIKTINEIPVLFPISESQKFYELNNTNLIFSDDLLKSAFFLLSGYQEYKSLFRDPLNRYPYEKSIQAKLNITHKPVVNYYFEIIYNGIHEFCLVNSIRFGKKENIFSNFGFLLSHDIDRVDYYDIYFLGYKVKELLGLVKREYPWFVSFKLLCKGIRQFIKLRNKENPYWDFDFHLNLEKNNGIKSTFFFLQKDQKHVDSYYSFDEPRIIKLINNLEHNGCEVGLHGAVRTTTSKELMDKHYRKLSQISKAKICGIRQHRLNFEMPTTSLIQKEVGLKYDSSLGFAAHEGFRNSYCLPFKLFDFENDGIINHWEFPLLVMDVTLFEYRKLNFQEARLEIINLLSEVKKFHGIFSLLWHNGYFDENRHPGITEFYLNIIKEITSQNPQSVLGIELLDRL
ncbi:MAG: polysaccharide deacetylase family protein [Bacteroidota bacterium]|nr:polysaccharide deacetylase family protein [Bacteroidota bacterium]